MASLSQESNLHSQRFFQKIQKTFSLEHIDYLTPDHPVEFLDRVIKKRRSGQITMQFLPKFIKLTCLACFKITARVTTTGVKTRLVPKEDQIKCDRESHSVFRTAVGKLLWMSQLRDDIKHPVKELSRSLSTPQWIRLRQPQASPQVCQADKWLRLHHGASDSSPEFLRTVQGPIPVEIVSYSDSGWAGCQKSRRSTSGSLITM